ncbi:hypothetical protein [Mesorhizobium marinum]|uniref:hypothetical protein n=1 Tax=Mesorhizobium marinum TaxID=3228790 RepID=UPI003466E513
MCEVPGISAGLGWCDHADVYVVVQLCSDRTLARLEQAKRNGSTIIYCVCDRHFADGGVSVAGVQTEWRFRQLAEIAHAFIVPTTGMAEALKPYTNERQIFVVPDWKDYVDFEDRGLVEPSSVAAWFGNAGTGNYHAAEPYLVAAEDLGFEVRLISNAASFGPQHRYYDRVLQWRYETFVADLRESSFSIIAFDRFERQKSSNRLAASVMNGVPAILCGEGESAQTVLDLGFREVVVRKPFALHTAIDAVQDPIYRARYVSAAQSHFDNLLNEQNLTQKYILAINDARYKNGNT